MKKCESYIICDDVCGIVGRREVQMLCIVHTFILTDHLLILRSDDIIRMLEQNGRLLSQPAILF